MNTFFERRYIIAGVFIVLVLILLGRLFYMQIIDDRYLIYANNNVIKQEIQYPARGPIVDRNGKVLVQNELVYDVTVVPRNIKPFDTLEFCRLLSITKAEFDKKLQKAIVYSRNLSSAFEKQISPLVFASLQERLSEFPGFSAQPHPIRSYPDSIAAQFLGYIGEVRDKQIQQSGGYYRPGDYIGITGVEKAYENILRGQRGVKNLLVDSRGIPKGRYANGAFDTAAVAGERLITSLDSRIQKLGERLMKNKVGSIVAIEPSTGEILCFVSSPTYDPNQMVVSPKRGEHYNALSKDPYKPFLIRPIMARYPPGSSFKPLSALIALQDGIIQPQTTYNCPGVYYSGNRKVKCTHVHGTVNLSGAIAGSCNGYFSMVFEKLINRQGAKQTEASFTDWRSKVVMFGLGKKLGIDMSDETGGAIPKATLYDKWYSKGHWRSSTILSLAIGQGEVEATPLQLANIECIIANRGYYYLPHFVKSVGSNSLAKPEYAVIHKVGIDAKYFEPVIDGMQSVVDYGTARGSKIPGINMVGKTGTAQNRHGKDHSVFVAFAPRENPRIAIAAIVENSGDGGTWAAPISSFIIEKYLTDSIKARPSGITPDYYMNSNLLPQLNPVVKNPKTDSLKKGVDTTKAEKQKKAGAAANKKPAQAVTVQLQQKQGK